MAPRDRIDPLSILDRRRLTRGLGLLPEIESEGKAGTGKVSSRRRE